MSTNLKSLSELWLASRFIAAGLVNTAVGMSVILALDLGLHVPPATANALGYAIGVCVAWVMHRGFVFRAEDLGWLVKARYLATVLIAFSLNQATLTVTRNLRGDASTAHGLAQVAGIITYTVVQFALMRAWVFRTRALPSR